MAGVIWITGLSAAGKTTLGRHVYKRLKETNESTVFLDGDELRAILGETVAHAKADRLRLGHLYCRLCKFLVEQDLDVIIATVGMFHELHKWSRENISNYLEVFLDVPVSELIKRDPKNLYRRYFAGEIKNIAGLDMPVEEPLNPHLHFRFEEHKTLEDMTDEILCTYKNMNRKTNEC